MMMGWAEICERCPGAYVVLVDVQYNQDQAVVGGTVVCCETLKHEAYRKMGKLCLIGSTCLWTGRGWR